MKNSLEKNALGGAISVLSNFRNLLPYFFNNNFTNNSALGGDQSKGGALFLGECQFNRFINNWFENNTADVGGAIFSEIVGFDLITSSMIKNDTALEAYNINVYRRVFSLNSSTFVGNTALRYGGAISLTFKKSSTKFIRLFRDFSEDPNEEFFSIQKNIFRGNRAT